MYVDGDCDGDGGGGGGGVDEQRILSGEQRELFSATTTTTTILFQATSNVDIIFFFSHSRLPVLYQLSCLTHILSSAALFVCSILFIMAAPQHPMCVCVCANQLFYCAVTLPHAYIQHCFWASFPSIHTHDIIRATSACDLYVFMSKQCINILK